MAACLTWWVRGWRGAARFRSGAAVGLVLLAGLVAMPAWAQQPAAGDAATTPTAAGGPVSGEDAPRHPDVAEPEQLSEPVKAALAGGGDSTEKWQSHGREPRPRPLTEGELLEFLETVVHGRALDAKCDLLGKDEKSILYLAYLWGRSIATNDNYPPGLFLTVIAYHREYNERMQNVACNDPRLRRLHRQFRRFLWQAEELIRMEEVELGGVRR